MSKLTRETPPENIIRYVSTAEWYDLVQKLGAIEHRAESLIGNVCDRCCRYYACENKREIAYRCRVCPVTELAELIGV